MGDNDSCWEDFGDEAEETLSLCDLVMSSDANEYWNDEYQSTKNSSSSSSSDHDHQDFFEFFSQDFSAAASGTCNDKNIIFCGKLIPFKDHQKPNVADKPQSLKSKDEMKTNTSSCMFPWKISNSFNKSRTFPSSKGKSFNKSLSLPAVPKNKKLGGGDDKFDFSVKKVSVSATPVKSRWYLFAFGVGRFPMEIELKDMKMRQSRKNKAMKVQAADGVEPANVKGDKKGRRSAKGLWRLLKVLGCKSKHTNASVVQASFGCIPHV